MERDELLLHDLLTDWYDLFTRTRDFCAFGDNEDDEWSEPFDYNAFVKCMKETYQYFVRVSKEEAQAAQEAFGAVCKAEFDGAPQDEAAFVTALMTEESFAQAAKAFKSLKQCIRLLQD